MTYGPGIQARRFGAGTPFNWPVAIGYERPPLACLPTGAGAAVAGAPGCAHGIFGWVAPDGTTTNSQVAGGILAFMLPVLDGYNWQRAYPSFPAGSDENISGFPTDPYTNTAPFPLHVIRPGNPVVPATMGRFNTKFILGAQIGSLVWTDPNTGLPYASQVDPSYILTPWTVMGSGGANAVLPISTLVPALST